MEAAIRSQTKSIKAADAAATLHVADNHQSSQAGKRSELAQGLGPWSILDWDCSRQLLTVPLFGEGNAIPLNITFIEHHSLPSISLDSDLTPNSELTTNILHCMKSFIYAYLHQ